MAKYKYKIENFLFESKSQSEEAQKEAEGIFYIKERTSMDNAETVLKLYNQLIAKDLFRTPVGINFLCELRLILLASGEIKAEEIQPVPVPRNRTSHKRVSQKPQKNYKKAYQIAAALAVVFGISVVGMFVIMKISQNNVTILNYRNEIINEYQTWEKELKEKEAYLQEWEAKLQNQEITPE